jgi:hypothetical protein
MATLVREGGFPVFFLLAFGLVAMAFAVRFAIAPSRRVFRVTLVLCVATLLTSINGMFAAFAAVGHQAPDYVQRHPGTSLSEVVLLGFGESMAPGILGFTVLSLVSLILALGVWRQNPS